MNASPLASALRLALGSIGTAGCLTLVVLTIGCRPPAQGRVAPDRVAEAEAAAKQAIATERSLQVASFPERSVGITPFAVASSDSTIAPLAYGLADILTTDLQRSGQLQIVDRLRLDALLREVQLVDAGRVDPATAPRVGKLVGARRLVIGALAQRPGGQLAIDAQIADVASGALQNAVSAAAPLADVLAAEKELALRLLGELGVNLTPATRAQIEERPTRNIAALLAYSRAVRFEVRGDYTRAAQEYRVALRLDPAFSLAGERLSQVPGADANADRGQASSVARAVGVAVDRLNPVFFSPLGGGGRAGAGSIVDPTFPSQTVIVIVTITTPP
jgi:TolB-like protein